MVWARSEVSATACPKSVVSAESLALLEEYRVWKWLGRNCLEKLSARQLDAFITLAGGGFKHVNDLPEMEEEFFQGLFRNHLVSLFHGARAVIPHFKQAGGGSIITIGAAYKTLRDGNVAYATVKEGVIGFTRNLARELHPYNIRVNALCPGLVRQPLREGPVGLPQAALSRKGQPEDVAYAALYLASDEARWVTGQTLVVDRGDEVLAGQPRAF